MRIHMDYAGCDLSGQTFCEVPHLREADFAGVLAAETEFIDSDLAGADFYGATLTRTRFVYCDLRDAVFTDAQCRGATFTKCTWRGNELCDAWLDNDTILDDNHVVSLEDEDRMQRLSQQDTQPDTEQPILLGQHLVPSRETQSRMGVQRLFAERETTYVPSILEQLFRGNKGERGEQRL